MARRKYRCLTTSRLKLFDDPEQAVIGHIWPLQQPMVKALN